MRVAADKAIPYLGAYLVTMQTGIFLFGGVEMDDAGSGPPASTDRRYDNDAVWHATERLVDAGLTAERLGYDSYWLLSLIHI